MVFFFVLIHSLSRVSIANTSLSCWQKGSSNPDSSMNYNIGACAMQLDVPWLYPLQMVLRTLILASSIAMSSIALPGGQPLLQVQVDSSSSWMKVSRGVAKANEMMVANFWRPPNSKYTQLRIWLTESMHWPEALSHWKLSVSSTGNLRSASIG